MSELIIIIVSLIFSAFFSGMEIAFVSANKLRIELDKKQNFIASKIVNIFTHNSPKYIATMLIGNNIALVIYGIVMARLLEPWILSYIESESWVLLIQTFISTLIILVTAEFLPKTVFRLNANKSLKIFSIPLIIFYVLFYPITLLTVFLSSGFIKKIFKVDLSKIDEKKDFEKIDLSNLVSEINEEGHKEGVEHDIKIFKNALDFAKIKVRECMIPRPEIVAIEINEPLSFLQQRFIQTGLSRIPVYKDNIDETIGYVNARALFKSPYKITENINPLSIVPETMQANKLLEKFIGEGKSMALVVDEYGGTSGLITMEDIIEEIFGEIEDEHDKTIFVEKQIAKNEYLFSGRLEIDYLNEKYELNIPESEDYETLAGYVINHIEDIPQQNEVLKINHFHITVVKLHKNRLELIKIEIVE